MTTEPGLLSALGPFAGLPEQAEDLLCVRWAGPCEAAFLTLRAVYPGALLTWVRSGFIPPRDLTYAAEILGTYRAPGVEPILVELLEHEEAVVREGALLGLWRLTSGDVGRLDAGRMGTEALAAVVALAIADPSKGVRRLARVVLDIPD